MPAQRKYPEEFRDRAIRLVQDLLDDPDLQLSITGACSRVAEQLGLNRETLRGWTSQAQIDRGAKPSLSTDDRKRLVRLEKWNRELRRANAILKSASAFFAAAPRPEDLVERQFQADRPNRLWIVDFTYVATWSGFVYVAFVIDVFSRRIVGWRAATTMRTELVLDALEMAIWSRNRDGQSIEGLIHHFDASSQYTSITYSERLAEAGAHPLIGSVGDSYDNAMAESIIGLFKNELIRHRGLWKGLDSVEIATLEWVDWFNNRRLFEALGNIPPVEAEANHYRQSLTPETMKMSNPTLH